LFDQTDGWGDNHPAGAPVVVVTHRAPPKGAAERFPRTTVTGSVEEAIATAKEIAGDKCAPPPVPGAPLTGVGRVARARRSGASLGRACARMDVPTGAVGGSVAAAGDSLSTALSSSTVTAASSDRASDRRIWEGNRG
jgi:hypothetical protein